MALPDGPDRQASSEAHGLLATRPEIGFQEVWSDYEGETTEGLRMLLCISRRKST